MENIEKVYEKFIALNPGQVLALGGSLMLYKRGIKLQRGVSDIDFILVGNSTVNLPEGCSVNTDRVKGYERLKFTCLVDDVKCDFLQSHPGDLFELSNGRLLSTIQTLINAKILYISDSKTNQESVTKHMKDICDILSDKYVSIVNHITL